MLTRPTTEQVLVGIANELRDTVAPEVRSEPVQVLLGQIDQILRGLAVRSAHEIAWMHEEADTIAAVTGTDVGWPASLHLDDVCAWYDSVSRTLSAALDAAFAADDSARVAELKLLLDARSATEMKIVGGARPRRARVMRRSRRAMVRPPARFALAVGLVVASASCSGDDASSTDGVPAGGGTVAVATLPPVATTVATAVVSTAVPTASTAPPVTSAPAAVTTVGPTASAAPTTTRPAPTTSATPAPPCQLGLIVEQTQTAYEGIMPSDLACAEDWAAWIGRPEDELADGFFAVARWVGGSWELMNLGTAGVCADSGVPEELWTELGCFE